MSKKKNILPIASVAAVVVGLVAMWVIILKGNGSDEEGSGLIIVDESGSSVTNSQNEFVVPEDGTILENVDIYKSHDYPELSDGDFITLEELAENKDKYIQSMISGSYDNFRFVTTPDFDVPEEIGRYQIATIYDYRENAEEAIKYMVGEEYDESRVIDMLAERFYALSPYAVTFPRDMTVETDEGFGQDYNGIYASVGYNGFIAYGAGTENSSDTSFYYIHDIISSYYVADGEYADDTYTVGGKEISISQYIDMVDKYIDGLNEAMPLSTQLRQLTVTASYDNDGNVVLTSQIAPMYKSVPLWYYFARDNKADDEFNLIRSICVYQAEAGTANGESVEYFAFQEQYRDYKTLEEYDKIIAPDKAAQLLSAKLAPDLDADIVGMGLTYYSAPVGSNRAKELPTDGHYCMLKDECDNDHYLTEEVLELTPFWAFYFRFDPDIIGLVNCKTGEVSYLHNYAN